MGVNNLRERWSVGGTGGRSCGRYSGNSQNSRSQEAKGDYWCLEPSLKMETWIETWLETLIAILNLEYAGMLKFCNKNHLELTKQKRSNRSSPRSSRKAF